MHWRDTISTSLEPLIKQKRVGLVTDLDGTISSFTNQPDQARVTPRNLELLRLFQQELALVAIVSGRSVAELRAIVGLPGVTYIGNHGLEYWANGKPEFASPEVAAYRPSIQAILDRLTLAEGMVLQDKGVTFSIHYRLTADPDAIRATYIPFLKELAQQYNLIFFQGKLIFEIRPPLAFNKGTALEHLVDTHALDGVVFLGDDVTDVDALRLTPRLRQEKGCYAVGVGVTSDDMSPLLTETADVLAHGVEDVEEFLSWLLEAFKAGEEKNAV